ncbi:hypothetical protein CC86DRAFT_381466 [Ophiobolus disseminans]|uniref:Uncharacterized protein n=1 Tax=Ophiobolus disseminans TaxID=1469910 RepID=A0A6A7A2E9_9PLEO|nr:hypothetical protein CC86DRAFT_381466 [Ophiobolus disseminans]
MLTQTAGMNEVTTSGIVFVIVCTVIGLVAIVWALFTRDGDGRDGEPGSKPARKANHGPAANENNVGVAVPGHPSMQMPANAKHLTDTHPPTMNDITTISIFFIALSTVLALVALLWAFRNGTHGKTTPENMVVEYPRRLSSALKGAAGRGAAKDRRKKSVRFDLTPERARYCLAARGWMEIAPLAIPSAYCAASTLAAGSAIGGLAPVVEATVGA